MSEQHNEHNAIKKIAFKDDTMKFQGPFSMCIAGPTQRFKIKFCL